MNTKTLIVWFILFAAVVLAVAAESSVDNKKQGDKQVETPTVEGKNDAKDSLNQGDIGVEVKKDNNYEVDPESWRGGGGHGGGWRGGGGHGGGWRGGGGGGWKGGGGRGGGWRGGGGGFSDELTTEQVNDDSSEDISQDIQWRGGGGGWRGGDGHGGEWRGGGRGWRGGDGHGGGWRGGGGGWRGGGGGWRGGGGGWRGGGGGW